MKIARWVLISFFVLLMQMQFNSVLLDMSLTVPLVFFFSISTTTKNIYREYATVKPELISSIFGMTIGFAEDLITGTLLGLNMCSKGLIGFLTAYFSIDVFFRVTTFSCMVSIPVLVLFDNIFYAFIQNLMQKISVSAITFTYTSLIHMVIAVVIASIFSPKEEWI